MLTFYCGSGGSSKYDRIAFEEGWSLGIRTCGEEDVYACELPSGTYCEVDEGWHEGYDEHGVWEEFEVDSVLDCILKLWAEAGYAPAVPSKVPFPSDERDELGDRDEDLDEIPF